MTLNDLARCKDPREYTRLLVRAFEQVEGDVLIVEDQVYFWFDVERYARLNGVSFNPRQNLAA